MRSLAPISHLIRFALGAMMICGLLLLPPSSAHAGAETHEGAAVHHATSTASKVVSHDAPENLALQPAQADEPGSFEGDPCCGGICLTAALCTLQGETVTAAQSNTFAPISKLFVSAETGGQLRPPRT